MTPEAKQAVMQLMGQTYGQQKKQDQMIVNPTQQLNSKSQDMQNMVKQLVAAPTAPSQQRQGYPPQQQAPPQQAPPQQQAPVQTGPPAGPISPEQAMAELQQQAPTPTGPPLEINAFAPVPDEAQLGFDFSEPSQMDKLLELQKETNLLLKAIRKQLEHSNVKPKSQPVKSAVTK